MYFKISQPAAGSNKLLLQVVIVNKAAYLTWSYGTVVS